MSPAKILDRIRIWLRTDGDGRYHIGTLTMNYKTGESNQEEVRFRATIKFAWYDFWVGLYFDTKGKYLYVCILPFLPIKIGYQ